MNRAINRFKINEFLEVRFDGIDSVIYVDSWPFRICKHLLLINPQDEPSLKSINSIDEAKIELDNSLEAEISPETLGISPKEMFWGHCSNLQAWYEHDYDTRVLHSNLSFPLLEELAKVGDVQAKRVFKEEIAKRFLDGYLPVIIYLLNDGYLEFLELEEIEEIIENFRRILKEGVLLESGVASLVSALCELSIKNREEKEVFECISELESLDQRESFAWHWLGIGKQFLKVNDFVEALKAFDRSLYVNNSLPFSWFYKGICFALFDPHSDLYYRKAVECVREAFVRDSEFENWERLGNIYKEAKEFRKAMFSFYKEVSFNTSNYRVLALLVCQLLSFISFYLIWIIGLKNLCRKIRRLTALPKRNFTPF